MGQTPGEIRRDIEQTRRETEHTLEAIGYRLDIPARVRYRTSTLRHSLTDALFGAKEEGEHLARDAMSTAAEVVDMAERRLSNVSATVQSGLSDAKEKVVDTLKGESSQYGSSGAQPTYGYGTGTYGTGTYDASRGETGEMVKSRARQAGSWAKDNALVLGIGAFVVALTAGMLLPRTRIETEKIAPIAGEMKEKAMDKGQEMAHNVMQSMSGGSEHDTSEQYDEPGRQMPY